MLVRRVRLGYAKLNRKQKAPPPIPMSALIPSSVMPKRVFARMKKTRKKIRGRMRSIKPERIVLPEGI
jgi:hypothetical protein